VPTVRLSPGDWDRFLAAAQGDLAVAVALAALRKVESGGPGREMGVLSVPAETYDEQVRIAARSFVRAIDRYESAPPRARARHAATGCFTDEFLLAFSARWAPLKAENDPEHLNMNHAKNLRSWHQRYLGRILMAMRSLAVVALALLGTPAAAADGQIIVQSNTFLHVQLVDAKTAPSTGVWVDVGNFATAMYRIDIGGGTGVTVSLEGALGTTKPADTATCGTATASIYQITSSVASTVLGLPQGTAGASGMPRWIRACVQTITTGTVNAFLIARRAPSL
jgi:hypothetical protein